MSVESIGARTAVIGAGTLASLALSAAPSWAAGGMKLCVPNKEGAGLVTPKHGKCKKGYTLVSVGAQGKEGKEGKEGKTGAEGRPGAEGKPGPEGKTGSEGKPGTTGFTSGELETLKGVLPCIKSVKEGIGGKPTVQFSGCNLQIVNGEGKTASSNGEGNLVIGYDENVEKRKQTGSHDLILGEQQEFTSFAGLVAGTKNAITGPYASISGGDTNTASGQAASVSGGTESTASGQDASVSGGAQNTASGQDASVSGGRQNTASGLFASVSGGRVDTASGFVSSVGGGIANHAEGAEASISGGAENRIGESTVESWIGGGASNRIFAPAGEEELGAAIFGGNELSTDVNFNAIP